MKKWLQYTFLIFTFALTLFPTSSRAQVNDDAIELYPSFRYRSVINTVVISYYKNDQFYIPISELFTALKIDFNIDIVDNGVIIAGKYLEEQTPYKIDLKNYTARFGTENYPLTANNVIIGELDYYFTLDFFKEFFELDFRLDINSLVLNLETTKTLPVLEQYLRRIKRSRAQNNNSDVKNYPIVYDRSKNRFNGGYLDYNISNFLINDRNQFSLNNSFGVELMGGDFQGSTSFNATKDINVFQTRNLRWRYVIGNDRRISTVELGQTTSSNILRSPYTGVRVTNIPIEPRRLFDEYRINGTTNPESEVELYLNDALIEFQKADGLGNYNFLVPLRYGNSRYDVRIYGPTGSVNQISNQFLVPFTFTPPGRVDYNLNVGKLDFRLPGRLDREYLFNGDISVGLTNWLSGKVGAEYYENFDRPTYTTSLSARILSNYLISTEYASNAFIKTSANVIYPNASGFNVTYTDFLTPFSIYNLSQEKKQLFVSAFQPFNSLGLIGSIRASGTYRQLENVDNSRFTLALSLRRNKFSTRISYSDLQIGALTPFQPSIQSTIQNSYSYSIPRTNNIPDFFKGTILRTQFSYLPVAEQLESLDLVFSKSIFDKGNIQLFYGRNILGNFNTFNAAVVIQFNKVRSNSTLSRSRLGNTYKQALRGSIGFDSNNNNLIFSNRPQTGRAATAVRLFVDNNGNSVFDEGDDKIEENAIRLDQSGASSSTKNGISYYTQLQPYWNYNMEINKAAIKNPVLVPKIDKFGVITDPNQFKPIDIPFFVSGVIEGRVERTDSIGSIMRPVSGLKLLLTRTDGDFNQEIRTFSEGSFYSYEIPPGNYTLQVEPSQLVLLNAESFPTKIDFEVDVTPNGDFIEGLSFILVPKGAQPLQRKGILIEPILAEIRASQSMVQLNQRYDGYAGQSLRLIIQAQTAYYERDLQRALSLVNESLNMFETAQGYGLQGSLYYLMGNKEEAQKSWEKVTEFSAKFYVPDLDMLDRIIKTELEN